MCVQKYTQICNPSEIIQLNHHSKSTSCNITNISVKTSDIKYVKNIKFFYPGGRFAGRYQTLDEVLNNFTQNADEFTKIPFNFYPLYYGPYFHFNLQINCDNPVTLEYEVEECNNLEPKDRTIFVNKSIPILIDSSSKLPLCIFVQATEIIIPSLNIKSAKIVLDNNEYNMTLCDDDLWKLINVSIDFSKCEKPYLLYELFDPTISENLDLYVKYKQLLRYEGGSVGFDISFN
jgi:hypothetical protein